MMPLGDLSRLGLGVLLFVAPLVVMAVVTASTNRRRGGLATASPRARRVNLLLWLALAAAYVAFFAVNALRGPR